MHIDIRQQNLKNVDSIIIHRPEHKIFFRLSFASCCVTRMENLMQNHTIAGASTPLRTCLLSKIMSLYYTLYLYSRTLVLLFSKCKQTSNFKTTAATITLQLWDQHVEKATGMTQWKK